MTQVTARIACSDVGAGEPTLLMVPGWCGDRTVFDPLVARIASSRRAIAVDLPDHGESPRTGADFDSADVFSAIADMIDTLRLHRVVPVALAHAGWTAIELRRQLGPERIPGVVLVDWMVLGPPPGFLAALDGLQDDRAWEQVRAGLFGLWLEGVDVPEVHAYVANMGHYGAEYWHRAGREIAAAFTAAGTPVAALVALSEPCPTLHVYAQPADEAVLAAQRAYAAQHPWFHVQRLDARSHFPTLEVPDEIAQVIEDFVCTLP